MGDTIELTTLELITLLLSDTKKTISYNKHNGGWFWTDRGSEENPAMMVGPFATWLDAAKDAVEPYMQEEQV